MVEGSEVPERCGAHGWRSVRGPMGLFARRQEQDAVSVTPSGGSPGPDATLPARFQVVSLAPGRSDDEVLMTGVVFSALAPRWASS